MDILINYLGKFYPKFKPLKCRQNGNILIVSNENLDLFFFNETALSFCQKADGKITLNEIISAMLQEYDVSAEELTRDIIDLVRSLQWARVLKLYQSAN